MAFKQLVLTCAIVLMIARPASAATPAEIQAAIEKAKAFLYSQQFDGERWERDPKRVGDTHDYWNVPQADSWGGWTALACYALLTAGENPQDPRMAKSIAWLR